jgi:restriction system protein
MLLDWLKSRAASTLGEDAAAGGNSVQNLLFRSDPYREDAPAIASSRELAGALEHLQYAVFRRYQNQLTRAERARLDNSIVNALYKVDRYVSRLGPEEAKPYESEVDDLKARIREGREVVERRIHQARRAELKLAQLDGLSPESFEEFVAELFEALGYDVEHTGGTGDLGVDLRLRRKDGLVAVVQCKYHKRGVVGSPELQRFLGTIAHTASHKGYFITTSTFSLAAENFATEHPIELVDGPRLVELVQQALGQKPRRDAEPAWF